MRSVKKGAAYFQEVAKDEAKVNVEEVATLLDHDVIVMPVSDAQHIGHHAVSGTGYGKHISRLLLLFLVLNMFLEVRPKHIFLQRTQRTSSTLLQG